MDLHFRSRMRFQIIFVILATGWGLKSMAVVKHSTETPPAQWTKSLDICHLDDHGRLGLEGIAALSSRELVAYCVTRNSNPNALSSREQTRESDPYQLNALFFDSSDGQLLSTKTWPTRAGTQSDIFPAGDKLFLLVAGDSVSLVDLKTLSTIRTLQIPSSKGGCERRQVIASIDGATFAASQICHVAPVGYVSEIALYSTADFHTIETLKTQGRNYYAVNNDQIIRWSTENKGLTHNLYVYSPEAGETTLHSQYLVSQSLFLSAKEVFCCRDSTWLGVLRLDGHAKAYRDADPKEPDNPKVLADQIFASRSGQRLGALIFHVPWAGAFRWECDVFDHDLLPLLRVAVPVYHHDVTAALSPDDKYLFVLRDDNVSAYSIPQSSNP